MSISKADQLKRNAPLKQKPYKNKEYLSWFHNQGYGCLVCSNTNIEAHHVESGNRGRADDTVVPLCTEHHRGRFSPHGTDAKEFHGQYQKDMMMEVAKKLHGLFKGELNV